MDRSVQAEILRCSFLQIAFKLRQSLNIRASWSVVLLYLSSAAFDLLHMSGELVEASVEEKWVVGEDTAMHEKNEAQKLQHDARKQSSPFSVITLWM